MNQHKRVVTVLPCLEKLTKVRLWGVEPAYHQITTILYREYVDYLGVPSVTPEYGVSLTDDRWGGFFHFSDHRTSENGRCDCIGGSEGKRRNPCRDFGIWKGTPEEVENNPQLTRDIALRAVYLNDMEIKEADRKEKAKEKAKINAPKAKAKRKIKQAQERAREHYGLSQYEEPTAPRFGNPNNRENHSVCGKPLPRSVEELETFKAAHGSAPEGNRWYCTCGETVASI